MSASSEKQTVRKSFYEVWRAFIATTQSLYKLAPCLVIVMAAVIAGVTWLALFSSKLMLGSVLLVVWGVAVLVYISTKKYGEAALALVAGLLTAYSVTWSPARFIGFVVIWAGFSFIAFLISSIRIASQTENIYRQASLAMADATSDSYLIEKELKAIGESANKASLGPIERAETIRVFAFRKMPLSIMEAGLKAVGMLSVITEIEPKVVSNFIADVYRIFDASTTEQVEMIMEVVYQTIRQSAAPPRDFMVAFEHSRRLVLSRSMEAPSYFIELRRALDAGVAPEVMGEYLSSHVTNEFPDRTA
jgi:hypothetical protein